MSTVREGIMDCIGRYIDRCKNEVEANPMTNLEWARRAEESFIREQTAEMLAILLSHVLDENGL